MPVPNVFFHVDLDAFFAAVEQLDHPEYRGQPVIIAGDPDKRGVVSTCSYEARKFGIHSAMSSFRAHQLCPQGIFLPGRMHRYHEKSREVMAVLDGFSPDIRQISVDEAFLDMSGTERIFGTPREAALLLKQRVHDQTGLTISVGVAPNRYLAKIASGLSKPDGLTMIEPGEEASFMRARLLKDVWGVGEKSRERLANAGLRTVEDILACPEKLLGGILGDAGASFLYQAVRGIDPGIMSGETASRSISAERTFDRDIHDTEVLESMLLELSIELMYRLLDEELYSKTVTVKIRYADFTTVSIQSTGENAVRDSSDLYSRARALMRKKLEPGALVRLIGLAVNRLDDKPPMEQLSLFDDGSTKKKRLVEQALHKLEKKRGKRLITRARLVQPGMGTDE
jgi:DNA polymerase-4